MRNKKMMRNLMAFTLAGAVFLSLGSTIAVKAQTVGDVSMLEETNDTELIAEMNDQLSTAMDNFESDDFSDIMMDETGIALADGTGDSYEANNGPGVATTGRYNQVTYGSIHSETDYDWYKIEILDATKPISVLLTNIPSGCDYDMFLVKFDDAGEAIKLGYQDKQTGATAENLFGLVPETGTYYVVIQGAVDVENNYSNSNYKLYIGDYYRVGQYGWVDTGLDIQFGYRPVGTTTTYYSSWYSYNLTNNTSIPTDAIVNKIYLDDAGNDAYTGGFYKEMVANGQGYILEEQLGGIDLVYSGDDELWVKQEWLIRGFLKVSLSYEWEPRILIAYKYPVIIQNARFL